MAIEWLAAAQGIDFLRPLTSSAPLELLHAVLRADIFRRDHDRYFAPDIAPATERVRSGAIGSIFRPLPGLPALWTAL